MEDLQTKWLVMGAIAMLGGWSVCCSRHEARRTARRLATMRRQLLAILGAFAIVCCIEAQKRGGAGGTVGNDSRVEQVERVEARELVNGGVGELVGVDGRADCPQSAVSQATREPIVNDSTDHTAAWGHAALPLRGGVLTDAERMARNWNRRGAADDSFWLDFDDGFVFPFGDGHLSGIDVLACGEIWPSPFDTNAVARLPSPLTVVAGPSWFSWEHTPSNTYLFAWDNCLISGVSNEYVSASVEIFRNGDVRTVYDGVAAHAPRVLPFPNIGIGQGGEWVSNMFDNASDILASGYPQWVDGEVGYDQTNGLYKLTVSFADDPPEATLLMLGSLSVVVTDAGDHVFLLNKGVAYSGQIAPLCGGVSVSAVDDMASSVRGRSGNAGSGGAPGSWTEDGGTSQIAYSPETGEISALWMPTLRGSPDLGVAHIGLEEELPTLEALLEDYAGPAPAFAWEGSGVEFSSPNGQTTDATFTETPGWDTLFIGVSATVGGRTLHSYLNGVSYGEHAEPEVVCGVSVQPHLIRRDKWMSGSVSAPLTVSFTSDLPTNGHFRAWIASGSEKIELSAALPSSNVSDSRGESFMRSIDGIATSAAEGDVVICCTLTDAFGGLIASNSAATTVIAPSLVSVPSAPATGLAVLVGTSVGATLDLGVQTAGVETRWYTARRKTQAQYDPWAYRGTGSPNVTLAMNQAGVFALKARTICGCQSNEVEYVHLVDEPYVPAVQENQGPCKIGMRNHIGVSSTATLLSIRNQAIAHLNLTEYGYDHRLPSRNGFSSSGRRTWKCNFFVADMAIAGGYPVPGTRVITHGLLPDSIYPPTANDWSDGVAIPGWIFMGTNCYPEPGFVAAHLGHCGIVDYDGWTISARTHGISRSARTMLKPTRTYSKPAE